MVRCTDRLAMTIAVDLERKATKQTIDEMNGLFHSLKVKYVYFICGSALHVRSMR